MSAPCCSNCRHKIDVPKSVSVFVDLTEPHCRKFVRSSFDKVKGETITQLPCEHAMAEFCGLGHWDPKFWSRINRFFSRF